MVWQAGQNCAPMRTGGSAAACAGYGCGSERTTGFPNGRLFLDSIEQALAKALVVGNAVRNYTVKSYRGGLSPIRLRRVRELMQEKMEEDLSLGEMRAQWG